MNKRSEYAKYVKDRNLSIANKKNVYNPELVNSISLPDILPNRYPEVNFNEKNSIFNISLKNIFYFFRL